MNKEIDSLIKNKTWILVDKPKQQMVVGCKWIFKKKEGARFKARLVANEFTQREGLYYNDIYSPVVRHSSIRLLLSLVVQDNLVLEQLDVKTSFLHRSLEDTIYMAQPEGYA